MANNVDVVLLRNRMKRRRQFVKLLIVLAAAAIIAFIYVKRDIWFPQLEGIGSRYQNVTRNEDAEVEGNFELSVSGGVDYTADFINNNLFILCDKYLYIYGTDGKLKDSRQHAYGNAVMKVRNKRALVYSSNGTNFRVDTPAKMLYEQTLDQPIWFGVLNDEGYAAIVTDSETYACMLSIFDANGKLLYSRECVERLSDVCFYGNGCIFSTISAAEGELITTLQYITFDNNSVLWETSPLDTLCLDVCAMPDGGAFVIGDSKAAYYSSTGALVGSYDYNATLVDYAFSDGRAAILLKNEQRRQSVLMLFSDKSEAPIPISLEGIGKSVIIDNEIAYVLGGGHIKSYSFSGSELENTEVQDAYEKILKYGKYYYLLGYDKIHRTDIK